MGTEWTLSKLAFLRPAHRDFFSIPEEFPSRTQRHHARPTVGAKCRGFVTAYVRVSGLLVRGVATMWRLEGVGRNRETRGGLPRFGPSDGGKSLRPACLALMMKVISITRVLSCYF